MQEPLAATMNSLVTVSLFCAQDRRALDMSTCAATSEYSLLKTGYYVDEDAGEPLNTASEILCMIKQA